MLRIGLVVLVFLLAVLVTKQALPPHSSSLKCSCHFTIK